MGEWKERKVAIVGAGAVGSTFAYALAQTGMTDTIVLIDQNTELMKGQVLDLEHGFPFWPTIKIREGSQADYHDAHVIVITAGAKQHPGESRLNLLEKNISIMENIALDIKAQDSQAVIVVVSNPVDLLTHAVVKKLDWPRGRVIGSGTFLDSARFRYLLSQHCGIDVHNVHAYILGEHGDSEFVPWSMTHIAGMPLDQYCLLCNKCDDLKKERRQIEDEVRDSAYHIIDYKGSTNFAIGLALVQIVASIIRNQHSILTVSTLLDGEYGLHDVCISIPCILSQFGVEQIIEERLTKDELQALVRSADVLRKVTEEMHDGS
jgi:L-lactate dehydrogenase